MSDGITIGAMRGGDAEAVERLARASLGPGYYPLETVLKMLERSTWGDTICSHVAREGERVVGFRFALPPGRWSSGRGQGLSPERWPAPLGRCGYFQSAHVLPEYTGRGIGTRMAAHAVEALRTLGADAIVTHSWEESPHGSSGRYLARLGFEAVAEHPDYWIDVDYACPRDGKPCRCTAIEMVLDLRGQR